MRLGARWGMLGYVALAGYLGACLGRGSLVGFPDAPTLYIALPSLAPSHTAADPDPDRRREGLLAGDPILSSSAATIPSFQERVDYWIDVFETREARWFPEYLERMTWFEAFVDESLTERDLPASLRFLPIIESGYSPTANSRVSAGGLWQFMAPTAALFDMEVSELVDERRDPFKSTQAAAAYLEELEERFGSWFLALAAYNAGPSRLDEILRRRAPFAPRTDGLYWIVRDELPSETRDFVPKLFAAARIAQDPEAHGFRTPLRGAGFQFEEVTVRDATTLEVVAGAAGVAHSEIKRLNPEIITGLTPPGRRTTLRVPRGRSRRFRLNYARVSRHERATPAARALSGTAPSSQD